MFNSFYHHTKTAICFFSASLLLVFIQGCDRDHDVPETKKPTLQIIVGTYTKGDSEGVYGIDLDTESRHLSEPTLLTKMDNPSYVDIDHVNQRMYVVDETENGGVSSFQWSAKNQDFTFINRVSSMGAYPCYVALDAENMKLAVANYVSGNVATYGLDSHGRIAEASRVYQHHGAGANKERQEAPHAHWVEWAPSSKDIYSVDLGSDRVNIYRGAEENTNIEGKVELALALAPGDGPRHMANHPSLPVVYVLNELSNTVVMATRHESGNLRETQRISTLPSDFSEHSQAAAIYVNDDADVLYVSNRGHDSIAVFSISKNGTLALVQVVSTEGDWPRSFLVLETLNMMLIANQESNSITVFDIGDKGKLEYANKTITVGAPVYLGRGFDK